MRFIGRLSDRFNYSAIAKIKKEESRALAVHFGRIQTAEKITEHMRRNAFMRINGFCYSATRSDRALLHDNLVPWQDLPDPEKFKD